MKFFEKIKNNLKKNKPVVAFLSLVVFLVLITFLLNVFNKNKIIKKGSQYIAANSDFRIDFEKHKNDNNKIRFARRIKEKGWFGREKQLGLEFEVLESNLVQYNQIKINRDQSQFNDLEMDNQLIPSLNEFDLATSEAWLKSKETRKLKAPKFDFVSNQKLKITDVFEGVEIDYSILKDNGLKEEIIINGKDKFDPDCFLQGRDDCLLNHNQYKFQLTLDKGLSVETDSTEVDGKMATKYNFVDEAGNIMFYFAPLFAIDNGGDVTYNVSSSLVRVGENDVRVTEGETQNLASLQGSNQYVFTLTVDPNWFFDNQRSYPIIIDPTILTTEIEHQGTGAHFNTHVSTDTDKIALDVKHNLAQEQQFDDYDYRQKLNYAPIFIDNLTNPNDLTDYQINFTNPLFNEDGLVLSLHFDEGEGLVARDSSGNYNDGTINGATWTTDARAGKGLSFDGVDDYVSVDNSDKFHDLKELTFSFWSKINSFPTTGSSVVIGKNYNDTDYRGSFWFEAKSGGRMIFFAANSYLGANGSTVSNLNENTWYNFTGKYDGKFIKIYVNGIEKNFYPYSGTIFNTNGQLKFAKSPENNGWSQDWFDGFLDEVKIYNRALSDEEIQALYYLQKPNFENIQFADSDRNTKLNYWKENDNSFWVKVPEIKANSKKTIYSYLDENVKTSESNGDEVFDFFDDFNDDSLDTEKWETAIKAPASVSVGDGLLELNAQNLTAHSGAGVIGVNQIPDGDYVVQARAKRVNGFKGGEIGLTIGLADKSSQDTTYYGNWSPYSAGHLYEYTSKNWRMASRYLGWDQGDLSQIDNYENLWIDEEIIIDNTNKITKSQFNYPSGKVYNLDSPVNASALSNFYPMIHLGDGSINSFSYVDKYFVRKYTPTEPKTGTVVDVDGNVYSTVTIGNQTWLQQNLKVTKDPNSQDITRYCYNDDPANCEIYGGLYDWNTVMNGSTTEGAQGICPVGFHVPTDGEWHELESFLTDEGETCDGGRLNSFDCNSVCEKIKTFDWNGLNLVDFFSLAGGIRRPDLTYDWLGERGEYWTSTKDVDRAFLHRCQIESSEAIRFSNAFDFSYSLRCIKNSTCQDGNCSACSVGDTGPTGGVVFYKDSGVCYEAPKFDQSSGVQWGCQGTEISGADGTAIGSGYQNTKDILSGCATRPIAASVCDGFVLGEKTDWFLPSRDLLNEMYGQKDVIGGFDMPRYYTSNENNADVARYQYFETGVQDTSIKNTSYAVRCARRF